MPKGGRAKHREEIIARQEKVFQMRSQGATFDEIAKTFQVSLKTVQDDARVIAKMKYEGMIEKDFYMVMEQSGQLDELLQQWFPLVKLTMDGNISVEEVKKNRDGSTYVVSLDNWQAASTATDKVLKILERRAKLMGLDRQPDIKMPSAQEIGDASALSIIKFMQQAVKKPIQAEVIENQLNDRTDTRDETAGEEDSQGATVPSSLNS